jgi:hypothetical protein
MMVITGAKQPYNQGGLSRCEESGNGAAQRWLAGSEYGCSLPCGRGKFWQSGRSFGRPVTFIARGERW